jgi:hypothetical protein
MTALQPRPPRIAERLLGKALGDGAWSEMILGDLHEEHGARATSSKPRAAFWYWRQVCRLGTNGIAARARRNWPSRARRSRQLSHNESGAAGSQENGQPDTTSISGSSAANARAAVDLAVPRSPRISTPPMLLEIAFKISARFMRSWPTMAVKG